MTDRAEAQLEAFTNRSLTETLTYTPNGGAARSIAAVVNRPGRDEHLGRAAVPTFAVQVINDSTLGIALSELDLGGDTITLAERVGGAAVTRKIVRLIEQDAEWVQIEVR